jgi:signal transduction histidine kinase
MSNYVKSCVRSLPAVVLSLTFQLIAHFFIYRRVIHNMHWSDPLFQAYAVSIAMIICILCICLIHQIYAIYTAFLVMFFCCWFSIQICGSSDSSSFYTACSVAAMLPAVTGLIPGLFWFIVIMFTVLSSFRSHQTDDLLIQGISFSTGFILTICCAEITLAGFLITHLLDRVSDLKHETAKMVHVIGNISGINLEYQNYVSKVERSAVEKERQRISREIHDIIGYTMTNTLMLIQAAQSCSDRDQMDRLLDKARLHLSESVDEARMSLRSLREERLDMLHGRALFSNLITTFSEITGIKITADFGNLPELLHAKTEQIIFRMIEESMTNTFKHGNADFMSLHFLYENSRITVRIFDNGKIKSAPSGTEIKEGIGMKGMRERLEPLHGSLSAGYVKDGFLLQAVIPEADLNEQHN